MSKKISYGLEAVNALIKGYAKVAKAVGSTLGPKGRNVILANKDSLKVTKDGVSVAEFIELSDPLENAGAMIAKEIAKKSLDVAGDGTTTATILGYSMIKALSMYIGKNVNIAKVLNGMDLARQNVIKEIRKMSRAIAGDYDAIKNAASVSANGDQKIGGIIADAFKEIGEDGIITVEDGKSLKTELETVKGMSFDKGYTSPYFVNNSKANTCELENPLILLYSGKISSTSMILPILESFITQQGRSILIISEGVDGEALTTLIINSMRKTLKVCCVNAPGFGDSRKNMMIDIAAVTGGVYITEESGFDLKNVTKEHLGSAKTVKISKNSTIIVDGAGAKDVIDQRCELIREEIKNSDSDYEKDNMKKRLAKIKSGVAVIKVGGGTETEVNELKDRFDDALHTTRAAVQSGIVPGGGVSLIRAMNALGKMKISDEDERIGFDVVRKSLSCSLETMVRNAGGCGPLVVEKVKSSSDVNYGYNVAENEYCDMVEAGIIDAMQIVAESLNSAVSSAKALVSTSAAIYPDKDDSSNDSGNPQMPSHMM